MKPAKCPICGSEDHIEFVFSGVYEKAVRVSLVNPSDFRLLRVCPNLHVFSEDNEECKVTIEEHKPVS